MPTNKCPLTKDQLAAFAEALDQALNPRGEGENFTLDCAHDHAGTRRVLEGMGFSPERIEEIVRDFIERGGSCDCLVMAEVVSGPGNPYPKPDVLISLPLFGTAREELAERDEINITAEDLRALGQVVQARLEYAAAVVEKLAAAGWDAFQAPDFIGPGSFIVWLLDGVATEAQAEALLRDLGIDPETVCWIGVEGEGDKGGPQPDAAAK
jgi:hypothetical protein